MKKLLFLLLFVPYVCFSQNGGAIPSKVFSRLDINSLECKIRLMELSLKGDLSQEYGSGVDMTRHLISHVDTLSKKNISYSFLLGSQKDLDVVFHNFGTGKTDNIVFLRTDSDFPVSLLKYKGNLNMILVTNMLSPNVYNTLRLNSRERAYDIISSVVLELASTLSRYNYTMPIGYIGGGICYSIEDFSNKRTVGANAEFVYAIFPMNLLKQYRGGNISEDDLIRKADIFISESESNNLKKIDVN